MPDATVGIGDALAVAVNGTSTNEVKGPDPRVWGPQPEPETVTVAHADPAEHPATRECDTCKLWKTLDNYDGDATTCVSCMDHLARHQ
jgi:hypothetical protein